MELFWLKRFGSTSIADILKPQPGQQRQPLLFLPRQAGRALLRCSRPIVTASVHTPRARLEWRRRSIERVFALLSQLSPCDRQTECQYGCPIGSLALCSPARPTRSCAAGGKFFGRGRRAEAASSRPAADIPPNPSARSRELTLQRHGRRCDAGPHVATLPISIARSRSSAIISRRSCKGSAPPSVQPRGNYVKRQSHCGAAVRRQLLVLGAIGTRHCYSPSHGNGSLVCRTIRPRAATWC